MADNYDIRWQRLTGWLGTIAYELTRVHLSHASATQQWRPAINAYRSRDSMVVCVDLAGVERSWLDLQVEPRRLLVRGRRRPPEPDHAAHGPVHVLVMEIDCGRFERELRLPAAIDPDRATAEYQEGLLWIELPFQSPA